MKTTTYTVWFCFECFGVVDFIGWHCGWLMDVCRVST